MEATISSKSPHDGPIAAYGAESERVALPLEPVAVALPFRRDLLGIMALFAIMSAATGASFGAFGLGPTWAVMVGIPAAMIVQFWMERLRAARVASGVEALAASPNVDWFAASVATESQPLTSFRLSSSDAPAPYALCPIATALRPYARLSNNNGLAFRKNPLRAVAATLARCNHAGWGVRIASLPADLQTVGAPIAVPFEPTLLREDSELLLSLGEQRPTSVELTRERFSAATRAFGSSRLTRVVFVCCIALALISLVGVAIKALTDLLSGRSTAWLRVVGPGALAGLLPAVLMLIVLGWRSERWYVVPGGIAVRVASWWNSESTVEFFPRSESVLAYWLEMNCLAIGHVDGRGFSTPATARMADLAFRAWLSPIPPPAADRLSDLC